MNKTNKFYHHLNNLDEISHNQMRNFELFLIFMCSILSFWLLINDIPVLIVSIMIFPLYYSLKGFYLKKMSFERRRMMIFLKLMRTFIPLLLAYSFFDWFVPLSRQFIYITSNDIITYILSK